MHHKCLTGHVILVWGGGGGGVNLEDMYRYICTSN